MIPLDQLETMRDQLNRMVEEIESMTKMSGVWTSKHLYGAVQNLLDAVYFIQAELKEREEPDEDVD